MHTTVRTREFIATFGWDFNTIGGHLDEIEAALSLAISDSSTREYFLARREVWLRKAATLLAAFREFASEFLLADADELLAAFAIPWLREAKLVEPFRDEVADWTAGFVSEYRRVSARLN